MSMYARELGSIPEETARVARAACPKGTLAMRLRDELGELYQDEHFASLYPVEVSQRMNHGDWLVLATSDIRSKIRLILQPYVYFCLLLLWLLVFDIPCLRAGFAELTAIMNLFHAALPT